MNEQIKKTKQNTACQYWKCQLVGWCLASLYWAYIVYVKDDYSVFYTLINSLFDVLIGIGLTHSYQLLISKSKRKSYKIGNPVQWFVAIMILSVSFMVLVNLKWYVYWDIVKGQNPDFATSILFWDPPLITGLRLMSIWVLAYHLYHYHKEQITLTQLNAELSILAKQTQLDHLSNQLNPHFLFNSLNSVKSLVSENPSRAKRSIDMLSDLLRSFLYTNDNQVPVEKELQLITDYLELERLRFEERLKFKTHIDNTLLPHKIPALSIQTLVENALKHGVQNSIKGGVISLSIAKRQEDLEIIVQNPGRLSIEEGPEDHGLGLKNLEKRLQLQYQERATFNLVENPKGLITGTIRIPLT